MPRLAAILIVSSLMSAPLAFARNTVIVGQVVDNTGAALPGVNLTLVSRCKCSSCSPNCWCCPGALKSISDANGGYSFQNVGAGEYEVKASLDGYFPVSIPMTVRDADSRIELRITLSPSAGSDTIAVTARAPTLKSYIAGFVYDTDTRRPLPSVRVLLQQRCRCESCPKTMRKCECCPNAVTLYTDKGGYFEVNIPPGIYEVMTSAGGHATIEVKQNFGTVINVQVSGKR